jgi:hypothetical protein
MAMEVTDYDRPPRLGSTTSMATANIRGAVTFEAGWRDHAVQNQNHGVPCQPTVNAEHDVNAGQTLTPWRLGPALRHAAICWRHRHDGIGRAVTLDPCRTGRKTLRQRPPIDKAIRQANRNSGGRP